MTSYPTQESFKKAIAQDTLLPLRIQQPVLKPTRYVTGQVEGLLTAVAETASLSRIVVASIAGTVETHPRDIAIYIMEQWASTGDQLPPAYDILGSDTPATAKHRLLQYQEKLAAAVNPKHPLLLIEGYDQLSVPVSSFLIPVILEIASHTGHNQLPGAVIMSGQTTYEQLSTHLRPINLNPYVTEDSVA